MIIYMHSETTYIVKLSSVDILLFWDKKPYAEAKIWMRNKKKIAY